MNVPARFANYIFLSPSESVVTNTPYYKMLALKKKMEAKNTAATQPAPPVQAAEGQTKQTSGQFQLSKQPSKELADLRAKTTATTGVFGLAKKGNKGAAAGQKSAAELRAQKGAYEEKRAREKDRWSWPLPCRFLRLEGA